MQKRAISGFGVLALIGFSTIAQAASIAGKITDTGGVGIDAVVRLWSVGAKDTVQTTTTPTASDGTYSFTGLTAGDYKVDAIPGPTAAELTDRWYDAVAPNGNGYSGPDADILTLVAATALNGINIVLEPAGGLDSTVVVGATLTAGLQVRVEQASIPDSHHNDLSHADPHLGEINMHDLPPAADWLMMIHDPMGLSDTYIDVGPYAVSASTNSPVLQASMPPMPGDPSEPNNSATDVGSAIKSALFRQSPPQPFNSSGAIIAPRGADADWYCFTAKANDRFLIDASSTLKVGAAMQEDPWVDPMVSFWSVVGAVSSKLLENDDASATTRAAHLDTSVLAADGSYCVVVSTFGDTGWTGAGQSAGHYDLTIKMGNRPPVVAATYNALPTPPTPAFITINEGDSIQIDMTYSDPESDPLTVAADFRDSANTLVTTSTFTSGAGVGTFNWTASYTATRTSPYTLTLSAADAEFTTKLQVIIQVAAVNVTPTTPGLVSPADGGVVKSYTPVLAISESTDLNLDNLVYDLDLTYGDAGAQQGQIVQDGGPGSTPLDWTVATAIPEDSWVNWRARAFDGDPTNGYSPWTNTWIFYVNVLNEPPTAPVLTKPADGDTMVMVVNPALSVDNPTSIDNDPMTITFEIATDAAFTTIFLQSPAVPMNTQGNSTSWVPTTNLAYGTGYYARAFATANPGGVGPFSNVNHFTIKPYLPPSAPAFLSPFLTTCNGLIVSSGSELATIQVGPSVDPEGAPVTIQLQIFEYDQDPNTATPLLDQMLPSTSPSANFNTSSVTFVSGKHYRFRTRANDGTASSSWVECDASYGNPDGGSGSGGKTGCSCSTGPDASAGLLFGIVALALWRRRRDGEV